MVLGPLVKRDNIYGIKYRLNNQNYNGMIERNLNILNENLRDDYPEHLDKIIRDFCGHCNLDQSSKKKNLTDRYQETSNDS